MLQSEFNTHDSDKLPQVLNRILLLEKNASLNLLWKIHMKFLILAFKEFWTFELHICNKNFNFWNRSSVILLLGWIRTAILLQLTRGKELLIYFLICLDGEVFLCFAFSEMLTISGTSYDTVLVYFVWHNKHILSISVGIQSPPLGREAPMC